MKVWDGRRKQLSRNVVVRHEAAIGPFSIISATENLSKPTDWCFEESHHTVVVHLGGELNRMECEFSAGPSGHAIPARGDVWIIPAACRYAALAQGDSASFVEFRVPTSVVRHASMQACVQRRDDFLFGAAAQLKSLIERQGDDLAAMASRAIADALLFHFLDQYGRSKTADDPLALSEAERRLVVDAIKDDLDGHHSLDALADLVGRDVRRFTAAFQRTLGTTPWQYVLRSRLDEAARCLREGDRPITEIALSVGFSTPSHFTTSFSKRFGTTPSRYRAACRS